ncbi:glycosyltransferase family 2 protein [Aquibium carbonis]|uniref:Glycosyltransferase family 2 protein n=1 Tax=Aquibium carbonis TaxID=2495581 RepID=A0A3S0A8Q9_9HYPH|nr:glycosyltransferase family 2 protein [Aquibium carbonis]RST87237.1 glycosyltransferase family 2 protein [Aquibium carbonis]
MPDSPLIAIITPTHNRRAALLRAVESVRAQSLAGWEHVVVDDGSTDGTVDALAAAPDDRLTVLRLPGWRGANAARNAGIEASRAPLVTFLDSDDVFLPNRLRDTVALFDADPDLVLTISSFEHEKNGVVRRVSNPPARLDAAGLESAIVGDLISVAGSAITVRRQALDEAGRFDETLMRLQDRDLFLRLARRHGARVLPDADWIKYTSPDSISRPHDGYVEAFSELVRRHPCYRHRYPSLAAYMVARRLLGRLLQGEFGGAWRDYRVNRASPSLGFSVPTLATAYLPGRRQRRRLRDALRAG